MKNNKIEQYKELCRDNRHYNTRLWILPIIAFVFSLFIFNFIYEIHFFIVRFFMLVINILVFCAFLYMVLNDRVSQLGVQETLKKIAKENPDSYEETAQGTLINQSDPWYIKMKKKMRLSGFDFMFYVMFVIFILNLLFSFVFILIYFIKDVLD